MKYKEFALGIVVLFAVLLFIIPLPAGLLDFLIAVNIMIALILILNAVYVKEPIEMSVFPTLLLLTTIFRLGLNLGSTRLILSEGQAGEIIKTFGSWVASDNAIVGVILFIIIVIINFLVITKGAERVSEVTARFTLDAMPGKQMSIDADLNSGAITEAEAKIRRAKIQQESSFYGAMDGASKFVKNDSIAGIIITFINIIGGIILGATGLNGETLTITEALSKYTILTIGDGLVSSLPSLLTSVSMGILITKSAKDSDLGDDIMDQLFGQARVMTLTGWVLFLLGVFTPLPWYALCPVGLLCVYAGNLIDKRHEKAKIAEEVITEDEEIEEIRKPENVIGLLQVDPIELEFGYGIIPFADKSQGGDMLDRVAMIRKQVAVDFGTVVPIIRLRDNIQLNPNQYVIKIKGVEVVRGEIMFDHYLAIDTGFTTEQIQGIETVEPAYGMPAIWIAERDREKAELNGYTVTDVTTLIITHLTETIKAHLHEFLTRQDVNVLIEKTKETNDVLISELVPKLLGIGEIQKVLSNLLKEKICIRDLVTIFETLADFAPVTRDTDLLTEYVRQALARAISQNTFYDNETNRVLTLDPKVEQDIMDSIQKNEAGSYAALEPSYVSRLIANMKQIIDESIIGNQAPIILTSPIVRIYFKKLINDSLPNVNVISYNEVDSKVEIQSIGMVTVDEN
ncbi:MAG: flagellar biosynthesis protein FlhA [Clostridia bacterium]|nr:flagellar biosynthesis protein FlhA [Clostridia bacterium]